MKVFVENRNPLIVQMFHEEGWTIAESLDNSVGLVCFEGGADVSPELYNEENTDSHCSPITDLRSIALYQEAKRLGIFMVGICRGGQFLNVMAGGSMIQDYPRHAIRGTHPVYYREVTTGNLLPLTPSKDRSDSFQATSTHHQVMVINPKHSILLGCGVNLEEVEIAYHPYDSSLSFQPHPEYTYQGHECWGMFFRLVDYFLD